jgi:hypothetical protein
LKPEKPDHDQEYGRHGYERHFSYFFAREASISVNDMAQKGRCRDRGEEDSDQISHSKLGRVHTGSLGSNWREVAKSEYTDPAMGGNPGLRPTGSNLIAQGPFPEANRRFPAVFERGKRYSVGMPIKERTTADVKS